MNAERTRLAEEVEESLRRRYELIFERKGGLAVVEVRKDGIRCNTVVVRIVDTPRNRAENPDADFSRWTTGAELAQVVEWLCSDASAPLSGGLIPAYGRA